MAQDNLTIFLQAQKLEITEYHILSKLAATTKKDQKVLTRLADDSLKHAKYWEDITKKKLTEDKNKVRLFVGLNKVFGLTFVIKLLEREERKAQKIYEGISNADKKFAWIIEEEKVHEKEIVGLLDQEFLKYAGSIVLGLSDALVELTGTLAGLTLSLQNSRLIGAAGLITGFAASLSMASSEYLSTKSGAENKKPGKASLFTGITYVCTTVLLIAPYFLFSNYLVSLAVTLVNGTVVIVVSSLYFSITQDMDFKKRLIEALSLSYGVAILSFIIGILVNRFLHISL